MPVTIFQLRIRTSSPLHLVHLSHFEVLRSMVHVWKRRPGWCCGETGARREGPWRAGAGGGEANASWGGGAWGAGARVGGAGAGPPLPEDSALLLQCRLPAPRGRGPLGPCLPFRGSVHEGAARRSAAHPPTRTRGAFPVWDDLSFGADLRFGSLGRRRQTHAHVRGSQSRLQKRGALARPPFHVGG